MGGKNIKLQWTLYTHASSDIEGPNRYCGQWCGSLIGLVKKNGSWSESDLNSRKYQTFRDFVTNKDYNAPKKGKIIMHCRSWIFMCVKQKCNFNFQVYNIMVISVAFYASFLWFWLIFFYTRIRRLKRYGSGSASLIVGGGFGCCPPALRRYRRKEGIAPVVARPPPCSQPLQPSPPSSDET